MKINKTKGFTVPELLLGCCLVIIIIFLAIQQYQSYKQIRILSQFATRDSISFMDLLKLTGKDRETLKAELKELEVAGKLKKRGGNGRPVRYFLANPPK